MKYLLGSIYIRENKINELNDNMIRLPIEIMI